MKSCRPPLARMLSAVLALGLSSSLAAQTPQLQLTQISPRTGVVDIANAGDGSGRLFMVNQAGLIHIHQNDQDLAQPFLDMRARVQSSQNEQGLLSVAFPSDYSSSGYFYVWYTGEGGDMVLSRFRVSGDPNVADPDSHTILLIVQQPFANHNGGRLQFGPDGMLYLGIGDGGGSFDPDNNGQNGDSLLGKLIRIDVDPAHGTYAVPADNPFVGNGTVRDEIWALGLRNPWRISFDRGTGDLYIADVGQNRWEEINFEPAGFGGGANYGWDIAEGAHCTGAATSCNMEGFTAPVVEYSHDFGCSVTGGEVYRGVDYPNMQGMYLYGDYCTGRIWGLRQDGQQWSATELADSNHSILTFGLGEDGNVYLASQNRGVYLLSDGPPVEERFQINAALNDAWFDPATDGQGFLIVVFPDAGVVFLAWFTYDAERPPEDVTALLGEPGHRWLTAQGPFDGDTAVLDLYVTRGGVFDSGTPAPDPPVQDGSITITWSDCNSALLVYEITSLGLAGAIPLQRIATDNVAGCEATQPWGAAGM